MKGSFCSWEEAVCWLRGQPDQRELVRACFYDDPLEEAAHRYFLSSEWCAIHKLLSALRGGESLDVGAGRGISSYALAREGWRVTALEPDSSDVVGAGAIRALAAGGNLPIQVVQEWGEDLPFDDESFDLVFCRQVLHHAVDLPRFCQEIARVLKPGGTLVAIREHVVSKEEDLDKFLHDHPLHGLYGGENAYLLKEYVGAIEGAGIRLGLILNPFASDINLYPQTQVEIRKNLARKYHLPEWLVSRRMVTWLGQINRTPGRLYSFVGEKI